MTDDQHDAQQQPLTAQAQEQLAQQLQPTRDDLIGDAFGEANRPLSRCIACEQVDDHPVHSVLVDVANGVYADWHLDCHAQLTGCPDCSTRIEGRPDGAVGGELLAHVLEVGRRQAAAAGQEG